MTKFERWIMARIIRKQVRQGHDHAERITEMYKMIREASEKEFNEDNIPTLNSFLTEQFNNSLRK